jgi:hypothetical protein
VTDTATFGGLAPDLVFFLNPNNSRIYAFAPVAGVTGELLPAADYQLSAAT